MNITEIKKVIQEQEKERDAILKGNIIERDVPNLINFLKHPNILAILGLRRCGKSVLSWLLMRDKQYGYINFDDESLYGISVSDLNSVLKAFYELYGELEYFVFDEIQNVTGWELFANRLRRTKKIIVTGSNSQLLSSELSTHLTGRHIDFTLFPFSFKEFCIYKGINLAEIKKSEFVTKTSALMSKSLQEYTEAGGIPEAYKLGIPILKSIVGDIITKDIIRRYKIKNVNVVESLAKYLISNSANEISFNKLKNIFAIKKVQTIKNYVGYFENAYLIFVIERFSPKLKQQIIAPKKIYCIDTGIINAISFSTSKNTGKILENIVCTQLLRIKDYGIEVYYWKDHQQNEVDFVVKDGPRIKQLVQVTFAYDRSEINERELKSLLKAGKELKCKNLLVITWDYEAEEDQIKFIPLWKWLLGY